MHARINTAELRPFRVEIGKAAIDWKSLLSAVPASRGLLTG